LDPGREEDSPAPSWATNQLPPGFNGYALLERDAVADLIEFVFDEVLVGLCPVSV
jgi:hypothetical protein